MNTFLNFISDDDRRALVKVFILRISNKVLILLLVVTVIFSLTLVGANYLTDNEIQRIKTEQENTRVLINGDTNTTIESAIEDLNNQTKRLADIQKKYVAWTNVFDKLETIATNYVHFNAIKINATTRDIDIQGIADTRDAYFVFEDNLRTSEYIENAKLPLSLLKEDIPFTLQLTGTESLFFDEN